jgi:hypothetical protein
MHARKLLANRDGDGRLDRGRKARCRTIGCIDHVTGEGQHVRRRQDVEHFAGARYHAGKQAHLSPHRGDRSGVLRGKRAGRGVALTGSIERAEQQGRFARGGVIPAGVECRSCGQSIGDFRRERPRRIAIAEQHRKARCVDARIRILRQRIGGQILVSRAFSSSGRCGMLRGAGKRIFPEPAAQAQDVRHAGGRLRRPLRFIEERMRAAAGARTRVRQRAPIQQLRVARMRRDRIAKSIAGFPRRAQLEVPADAVAGIRRVSVVRRHGCRHSRASGNPVA